MGGGGVIIIRNLIRPVAELEQVKLNISGAERTRLLGILGKDDGDWTKTEFNFLLRCIGRAHDKQS